MRRARTRPDDPIMAALRTMPLFEGVGDRQLRRVADGADLQSFRAGQTLMLEAYHGEQFLVVVEGDVDVERHGDHVATVGPGGFLGEAGLLGGGDRNATVRARTRVKVLTLGADAFADLREQLPEVAARIDREMARRAPTDPT